MNLPPPSPTAIKTVRFSNAIYQGLINNRSMQGLGTLLFFCGHVYFGGFSRNQFSGVGIIYYLNGMLMHARFQKGKLHGHAIVNFSKNVFFLFNFQAGRIKGRVVKYDLRNKSKMIFDSELKLVTSQQNLDQFKLFREVNRFLKTMSLKNVSFRNADNLVVEIGNFRLGPDRWLNGHTIDGKPTGFGVLHENPQVTKFGFFLNGQLNGFSRIDFRNQISYFGVRKNRNFEQECIMYVSKSNVFAESYQTKNNKSYELSKGVGLPFEKIFKLFQKSVGRFLCRFIQVNQFLSVDLLAADYQGTLFHFGNFIKALFIQAYSNIILI